MVGSKTRPESVLAESAARQIDGHHEELPVSEADRAVEIARRDEVMASAERVMRKHRATFAALAK